MIRIGTSGWSYNHWFGRFYPEGLAKNKALDYYLTKFDTVELNVSFYRLVPRKTYQIWHRKAQPDFLFSVKGSRYITHVKRLTGFKQPLRTLFETINGLENNLGPILFQFPSNFKKDIERLKSFAEELSTSYRYAFEFRNDSWFSDDVISLLQDNNIALVASHSPIFPYKEIVTADHVYIRLHGPGRLYETNYSNKDLREWAKKIGGWAKQGKDVFVYFNNDFNAFAPLNALSLKELVEQQNERAA